MLKSLAIFVGVVILLYLVVRKFIRDEREEKHAQAWLDRYGKSSVFQDFYAKNPYRKLGRVIQSFEEEFPEEVKRLQEEQVAKERYFNQSRERYNTLVFEYSDKLKTLKNRGTKWFTKKELLKVFDEATIKVLLEGHLIYFSNNKYVLHDKYEADHPYERDENGKPVKIVI